MKHLILVSFFVNLICASYASEVEIYRETANNHTFIQPSFKMSANGRSWIELSLCPTDPEVACDIVKIKNPGLSYDVVQKQIIFQDAKLNVCAQEVTRGKGIFQRTQIEMTESCSFEIRYETSSFDTGFEIIQKNEVVVYLKTN